MLQGRRQDHAAAQEKKLIEEAGYTSFQTLKIRRLTFSGAIPMERWGKHFKKILNMRQSDVAFPPTVSEVADSTFLLFSEKEVQDVIGKLKRQESSRAKWRVQ
jgi:hypothetical protein